MCARIPEGDSGILCPRGSGLGELKRSSKFFKILHDQIYERNQLFYSEMKENI